MGQHLKEIEGTGFEVRQTWLEPQPYLLLVM